MGKRKITVDTNILISALGWEGNPHRILEKIINGEIDLFISYKQFDEFVKVLEYPRFNFTGQQKKRFKELILKVATLVKTPIELKIIKNDPSDNRILECALVANVDYIITGDKKHILPLKRLGRIKIVTANDMLKLLI